ncbi:MAG: hypothetical protein PHO10_12025, partial [Gemmiger sp.]|nr:hypothetical protein [Gemmiger sp.]
SALGLLHQGNWQAFDSELRGWASYTGSGASGESYTNYAAQLGQASAAQALAELLCGKGISATATLTQDGGCLVTVADAARLREAATLVAENCGALRCTVQSEGATP